jgi:hypothetical protein
MNVPLATRNLALVAWNRSARLYRRARHSLLRGDKHVRESAKHAKAKVRHGGEASRDAMQNVYAGAVRTSRYWNRLGDRIWPAIVRDVSVRRELRAAARQRGPVIVGPWLSEVGYEALYWVPFVRWFADHYRVDPERLIVLSRGGVASWYDGVASRYVEQLELMTSEEFAARNRERQGTTDQKQLTRAGLDEELLARARARLGITHTGVCHPSAMFRLLRNFWLGTEALQFLLDYTRYAAPARPGNVTLPPLPSDYVAVKFYSGRALVDTPHHRAVVRALVERISRRRPVVALSTGLALDEHCDYDFKGLSNVTTLDGWVTPQNNLLVQTEVIRRATRFVGTCGSLAWLAPMLGTPTVALYADDRFLTPHLYAARHAYLSMQAATFTPVDLSVLDPEVFDWTGLSLP